MTAENEVFELCKQVYEATGWFEVSDFYVKSFTKKDDFKNALWEIESYSSYSEHMTKEEFSQSNTVPLYTSDYLLEKLQQSLKHKNDQISVFNDSKGWSAKLNINFIDDDDTYHHRELNDSYGHNTPLKALLKLTLKLHEEKIL